MPSEDLPHFSLAQELAGVRMELHAVYMKSRMTNIKENYDFPLQMGEHSRVAETSASANSEKGMFITFCQNKNAIQ